MATSPENMFSSPPPVDMGQGFAPSPPVPMVDIESRRRETEILSSLQYMLEPYVPEHLKGKFDEYLMLISKDLAISNIFDEDVYRYLDIFDVVILWLKFKKTDMAIKRIARLIAELQLKKSVRGFERLAQITNIQRTEMPPAPMSPSEKKKSGIRGLLHF